MNASSQNEITQMSVKWWYVWCGTKLISKNGKHFFIYLFISVAVGYKQQNSKPTVAHVNIYFYLNSPQIHIYPLPKCTTCRIRMWAWCQREEVLNPRLWSNKDQSTLKVEDSV